MNQAVKKMSPLVHFFGTRVEFLNLSHDLSKLAAELTLLLRANGLVVVNNANLSTNEFIMLGKAMGRIRPFVDENYRHPEHPEIFVVSNVKRNGKQFGMDRVGFRLFIS